MGLENLKSVFNDIRENTLPEKGIHGGLTNESPSTPAHSKKHSILDELPNVPGIFSGPDNLSMSPTLEIKGRHGGLTNTWPSTPLHSDDHSQLDNIEKNLATKLDLQTNSTAGKIVFPDNGSVDYSPLMLDSVGIHSGLDTFNKKKITDRTFSYSFDPSTLGKDQALGLGAYSLETLYNVNHTAVVNRSVIDTGKKDHKGNTIYINTVRAGMGALSNLDIMGYRSGKLDNFRGFDRGAEPYIIKPIGSKDYTTLTNRDTLPLNRALDDVSRLVKFYTSGAGVSFMLKENITNVAIGDGITLTEPFGAIMAPPFPVPNTGFLNFVQQSIQGARLGSIRKPFKIQYSDKANIGLPFGILGDTPIGIKELTKIEIPPEESGLVKKGLYKLKKGVIDKLVKSKFNQFPVIGSPTPFIDLSKGPKFTTYNDHIAKTGVEGEIEDFFTEESQPPLENEGTYINQGDFYVRIKDLRVNDFIYFRGYVTGITENVNPSFTPTNYIGRSEPVYQYERAERDLSFNLRVYPANAIELNMMYEKIEKLTSLAYPEYLPETDNKSLVRMKAPFTELYMAHIGSRVKGQFGFIKSLSYTVNDSGDWDALSALPRLFDIAISYQILNRKPPQMGDKFYRASV